MRECSGRRCVGHSPSNSIPIQLYFRAIISTLFFENENGASFPISHFSEKMPRFGSLMDRTQLTALTLSLTHRPVRLAPVPLDLSFPFNPLVAFFSAIDHNPEDKVEYALVDVHRAYNANQDQIQMRSEIPIYPGITQNSGSVRHYENTREKIEKILFSPRC